jgi:hypothetical protein
LPEYVRRDVPCPKEFFSIARNGKYHVQNQC